MLSPTHIEGSSFSDERGKLHFFNIFDMREIVRFYAIEPSETRTIRAWQGHKDEKKWFYCNAGSFIVHLVHLETTNNPNGKIASEKFLLQATHPTVLKIPGGYANGFRALEKGSKMMVFSNFTLKESKKDDIRYPIEKWKVDWHI
ncbi:MAG: hypothetical protein WA913_00110 [Pricia sp.]